MRRKVVYIGHYTGPRSGKLWALLLDCGHMIHRPMPSTQITAVMMRRKPALAPKKATCLMCSIGIDAHPETIPFDIARMDRLEEVA